MSAPIPTRPVALTAPALSELPSNVIMLRPGYTLSVPAKPIRTANDTKTPICSVRGTARKAKNPTSGTEKTTENDASSPVSYQREYNTYVDASCTRANAELSKAEFAALVRRLSAMELIKRFPLEYSSFKNMKGRGLNGCTIAPEFQVFRSFLRHMGVPRPSEAWTLDRIDPFRKEYGPGLCRWAPREVQANNRMDTIHLTGADGRTLPLTTWAALTRQDPQALRKRRTRHPEWTDAQVIGGGLTKSDSAPVAPFATPAPPLAGESYRDRWPPGTTHERWERPYQAFKAKHGHRFGRHLRRSIFFLWVAGGWLRTSVRHLERRFPQFRCGEWDHDLAYQEDPHRACFDMLTDPVMTANCSTNDSDRGWLAVLREACPSPESQYATLQVRFHDPEIANR